MKKLFLLLLFACTVYAQAQKHFGDTIAFSEVKFINKKGVVLKPENLWTINFNNDNTIIANHADSSGAKPVYSLMPFAVARELGFKNVRDNFQFNSINDRTYFNTTTQRLKSWDSLLLNIDESLGRIVSFPTDIGKWNANTNKVLSAVSPKVVIVLNEENNRNYFNNSTPDDYLTLLKATAVNLSSNQLFADGGLTWEIRLWYYSKTNDTLFYNNCLTNFQKSILRSTDFINIDKELDAFKNMPANFLFNLHLYLSNSTEKDGLIRMVNYLKNYLHHDFIIGESGLYVNDPSLMSDIKLIATATKPFYVVLYSGTNEPGKAIQLNTNMLECLQ